MTLAALIAFFTVVGRLFQLQVLDGDRLRGRRSREHHPARAAPDDSRCNPRRQWQGPRVEPTLVQRGGRPRPRHAERPSGSLSQRPTHGARPRFVGDAGRRSPSEPGRTPRVRGANPRCVRERRRQVPVLAHAHSRARRRPARRRRGAQTAPRRARRRRHRRHARPLLPLHELGRAHARVRRPRSTPRRWRSTGRQATTTSPSDEQQRNNPLGYEAGDSVGATGIEHAWEAYLRGQRGWEKRVVDARGRYRTGPEAERLIDVPPRLDPIPGRDLRLSIDVDLEQAIAKAMRAHAAGAVVVIDVRTGRLLALYSKPDFDPNDLSGGAGRGRVREAFNRLYADPLRPMLDKTMSGAFQPGSTMKPFSALAALEDHLVDPDHIEKCEGYVTFGRRVFRCSHVHGPVRHARSHRAIVQRLLLSPCGDGRHGPHRAHRAGVRPRRKDGPRDQPRGAGAHPHPLVVCAPLSRPSSAWGSRSTWRSARAT